MATEQPDAIARYEGLRDDVIALGKQIRQIADSGVANYDRVTFHRLEQMADMAAQIVWATQARLRELGEADRG